MFVRIMIDNAGPVLPIDLARSLDIDVNIQEDAQEFLLRLLHEVCDDPLCLLRLSS